MLKLIPPRQGRSKNWRIRGTWLGVGVDRSARTGDRRIAARVLANVRKEIESGELRSGAEPTFAAAALAYMKGGGERTYIAPLLQHFGETPIARIDQAAVDAAAVKLFPTVAPATRNRHVYTPVAAILHHHDPEHALRLSRPKMPKGRVRWLEPKEARRLIANAGSLRALVIFLLYTGCRLGEAINLDWSTVNLRQRFAYVAQTKNGDPRGVHLPADVVAALSSIEPKQGRVFGLRRRWQIYKRWHAMREAAGIDDFTPHDCRHTWATWMRRYAGADAQALVATGTWRDEKSAARYAHVVASEASKSADNQETIMPQFEFSARLKYRTKLTVEAETIEKARRLVAQGPLDWLDDGMPGAELVDWEITDAGRDPSATSKRAKPVERGAK
jgi:integrase